MTLGLRQATPARKARNDPPHTEISILNCYRKMMYRVLRHHSTLPHAFRAALNSVPELGPTAQRVAKGLPLSKIVATIGPASENHPVIGDVARAGMQIMRINFSHATYEEADLRTRNLNSVPDCLQPNVKDDLQAATNMRAIMLDTQGPEIRTGSFGNGIKEVEIAAGQKVRSPP